MKLFKDDSKAEIDIDGIKRIYDLNCTFYNILDGNILEGVKKLTFIDVLKIMKRI